MPTSSTAGPRVPLPDFHRAARLGAFLAAAGWLAALVGVVVGIFVAAQQEQFSVAVFLLVATGSVLAGLVVVGVGRALEIAAYVGDHMERERVDRVVRLPGTRSPVTDG